MILVGGCQCVNEKEALPMLDSRVTRMGISFRSHKKFKSVLQILYLQTISHRDTDGLTKESDF